MIPNASTETRTQTLLLALVFETNMATITSLKHKREMKESNPQGDKLRQILSLFPLPVWTFSLKFILFIQNYVQYNILI